MGGWVDGSKGGREGCRFDGLGELDTMARKGGRGGREGRREGRREAGREGTYP